MAKIRCKSCGKFIDESLCPHCGHNNYSRNNASQTTTTINTTDNNDEEIVVIRRNQESGENERITVNRYPKQINDINQNPTTSNSSTLSVNDKRISVALSLILSIFSLMGIFPIVGAIVAIGMANKYKKSGDTEYIKYVSIGKAIAVLHLVIVGITALTTLIPLITQLINALQ